MNSLEALLFLIRQLLFESHGFLLSSLKFFLEQSELIARLGVLIRKEILSYGETLGEEELVHMLLDVKAISHRLKDLGPQLFEVKLEIRVAFVSSLHQLLLYH